MLLYDTSVLVDHVCHVLSLVFDFVIASLFTTPPPACLTTSLQAAIVPICCNTLCTCRPLPACGLSWLHWRCYLRYESKFIAHMAILIYYMLYCICYRLLVEMHIWCSTLLVDVHVIHCHVLFIHWCRQQMGLSTHVSDLYCCWKKKQVICREWETVAWPPGIPSTLCDKNLFILHSDTIGTIDVIRGVTCQLVVRLLLCEMIVSAKWGQWT